MKKIFFICCIAISALALSTSASVNRHQDFSKSYVLRDTVPTTSDTMQNNMNQNNMNNQDTGMNNMQTDTSSTKPPR